MSNWSIGDGARIKITFDKAIFPITDNTENISHFTITDLEYDYVPGGTTSSQEKTIISISGVEGDSKSLILETDPLDRFHSAVGQIRVQYDGLGTLEGQEGMVDAFDWLFMPQSLVPKPNQNDAEHLEITGITATGTLISINYMDAQAPGEHFEITGMTATGNLIAINYIDAQAPGEHLEIAGITATGVLTYVEPI